MKRKITYILIVFAIVLLILGCSACATNVLIISEEDVVHGQTVTDMLAKISIDDYTIEKISIESDKSLSQTVEGIEVSGKNFDSVIIQLPFDNAEAIADITSAINKLHAKFGNAENIGYYLGTPAGKITNYDKEIVTAKENMKNVMSGVATKKITSIPVFENLKIASDKSLEVYSNNALTTLGDLLVACTYHNSLGKPVSNLTSYDKLTDTDVQTIVEIANRISSSEVETPSNGVVVENPTQDSNTTNTTNMTNNTNQTPSPSSSENKGEQGNLKASSSAPAYVTFKGDREPRLTYNGQSDYLYVEIKDGAGIACEYPTINGNNRFEAQKKLQPKIYYYNNDKRGTEVKNVKRPTETEYSKNGKEFVYRIGLPVSEIGEEFTKFEIVAYDVKSDKKIKHQIDEVFMVKKKQDGTLSINRAPASYIVALKSNMSQMALFARDTTGISKIELRTLPKGKGKSTDLIRARNGATKNDWSAITSVTSNKKYVRIGITKFEKISSLFKKSNWIGLNPKVSGQDEVYTVRIVASDTSGARSVKSLTVDTKYYHSGDKYKLTKNGTVKKATNNSNNDRKTTNRNSGSKATKGGILAARPTSILKRGSKGKDVEFLQERLNSLGYDLAVDGVYGPKTEAAVRAFQKDNKIDSDGVVGNDTWSAIDKKSKEENEKKKPTKKENSLENNLIHTPELKKDSKQPGEVNQSYTPNINKGSNSGKNVKDKPSGFTDLVHTPEFKKIP